MVNVNLSISTVNITNYLIATLHYNDNPNAEVMRVVIAPGDLGGTNNISFVNVIPKPAVVYYYESSDGSELTTLRGSFQLSITDKINVLERRYYTCGGTQQDDEGNVIDPTPGSNELTDSYFEGKTISGFFQTAFRYLKEWKTDDPFNNGEWKRVDNSIVLINPENGLTDDGPTFVENSTYIVEISYLADQVVNMSPETTVVYGLITESLTLDITHRRKWNKVECTTERCTLTAEPLATLVDGEWYGFVTNGGQQYQVVFQCDGTDKVLVNGVDKIRIVIGKCQRFRIYKNGSNFEILEGIENLERVGRFFKSYSSTELNALSCDGITRLGDDYPGAWDYILGLPVNFAVNSATVTVNDFGCWHYWETGGVKYFKTPNKQNMFARNLKSFSVRNDDTERSSDYPGYVQFETVGKHRHLTVVPSTISSGQFPNERGNLITWLRSILMGWLKSGGGAEGYYIDSSASEPSAGRTSEGHREVSGVQVNNIENRPTNLGEFEFVCV